MTELVICRGLEETSRVCAACKESRQITAFRLISRQGQRVRVEKCRTCLSTVKCNINGCGKTALARSMCSRHYSRWRHGRPLVPGATHPRDGEDRGLHPTCSALGCTRPAPGASDYCNAHTQRIQKHGDPDVGRPLIVKGDRYTDADGYVVLRSNGHPNGTAGGSLFEHVKVMSEKIGRPLLPKETVHQRNGIRNDNRPDNLELWSGAHPRGARVADQVEWANKVIALYGIDPQKWAA